MSIPSVGRLDIFRAWPAGYRAMQALEATTARSGLDPILLELVRTRVSQLNGCAFCLDMHARAAIAHGEEPLRLVQLATWRQSDSFTAAERAALGLTEEITQCAHGIADETLDGAREHFTQGALVRLIYVIAVINSWNRLAVADRTPVSATSDSTASQPPGCGPAAPDG